MKFSPRSPLISVITISFNSAGFIEPTIQSVLSQTYPYIEYIIIDGGSTDGTVDIIRNYASRLAYWHSKPDCGISHAFNLGWAQSHGQWLLFLNADDFFLEKSVVQKMVPHLIQWNDADVVIGRTIKMTCHRDSRPAPLRRIWGQSWRWQEFRFKNTIPHQSAFTDRRYFDRVGGFDETFRIAMDYDFFLRGGNELRVKCVPIAVSGMREGGVSTNIVSAWREAMRAQLANKTLPQALAWLNFFWRIGHHYLTLLAHKILDPLAPKITWPGKNSGKMLIMNANSWPHLPEDHLSNHSSQHNKELHGA
jgi:glycosyltransferase involved in cell wall biosynthesis